MAFVKNSNKPAPLLRTVVPGNRTLDEIYEDEAREIVDEAIDNADLPVSRNTWERDSSWLYCIDFLREEEHPYSWRYRYAVKWSIPTRRKPIPRATASVYITIEVSKFKPKTFPVEVYYIFETHHLVHRPGKTRFREKWLKDIIESKIRMMDMVRF
ncbi:PREDICTED: A-kinase anchor protein 14-like [Acropora digitifera]|uniref:A-kinase anchor protein 14-like n=1 Tax=Acropora digitifera TaxID=70779 RepID=UPI00077AB9D8|nr:PREDICTED: A-kinase anchor protein 14-like [Acropora digitifera]